MQQEIKKDRKIFTISSSLDKLRSDIKDLDVYIQDQVNIGDFTYDLKVGNILIDVVSLFSSKSKEYSEFNDSAYRTEKLNNANANANGCRLITYFDFYPYDIFFDFLRAELEKCVQEENFVMTYNYDYIDDNTIIINDIICNGQKLTSVILENIINDLKNRNNFKQIISYVDLNLYDKTVFEKVGFKEIRKTISPKMLLIGETPHVIFDCGQSKMVYSIKDGSINIEG